MYKRNTQSNNEDMVIDWESIMDYLSSRSVPHDRIEDVCSFVAAVVEAGIHLEEENVPYEISELFNGRFTFEVLYYVVGRVQHIIQSHNVALFC